MHYFIIFNALKRLESNIEHKKHRSECHRYFILKRLQQLNIFCLLTVFHSHNVTIRLMWNCQECLRQERSLLLPEYTGAKILTWYLDFGKSYSVLCLGGSRIFSFLLLFIAKCNLMERQVIDIVSLWLMFLPSWA